jgi:hypothetical protein
MFRNKPVKNDMRTGARKKNPEKTYMRTDAPRKPRKNDMTTGAPATKNPDKTI